MALRSANLTVEPGEIHALLGANGAGKSTLVKMLTGVIRPDAGTIAINDAPVRIPLPSQAPRGSVSPLSFRTHRCSPTSPSARTFA